MTDASTTQWDLFVCHASEDKSNFVRPLADAISRFGVRVWYDEFTLKVGDSISRSIDRGLAESSFGAVVLSPAFFAKAWTEYELRGLTAKEVGKGKIILPIWLGVTHDDVLHYSPPLADKRAILAEGKSITQIAIELIEEVRPDVFENIHKRLVYKTAVARARREQVNPKDVKLGGPIRHETLPPDLISRIRLIRAALLPFYPHSMAFWLAGFQRDAHPSREIAIWERIASVLLEYTAMTSLSKEQREELFQLVAGMSGGVPEEQLRASAASLPPEAFEKLDALFSYPVPVFDIKDDTSMFEDDTEGSPTEDYDVERFPTDLPDDLIEDLVPDTHKDQEDDVASEEEAGS